MSAEDRLPPLSESAPSPQLEHGWGPLCFEMARADFARLGGFDGVVLEAVLERSWWLPRLHARQVGIADPAPVPIRLNCSELARTSGLPQSSLSRSKRRLIFDGVLVEHPDGRVEPSKDYQRWRRGAHGPFAYPEFETYCAAGRRLLDQALRNNLVHQCTNVSNIPVHQCTNRPDEPPSSLVHQCTETLNKVAHECANHGESPRTGVAHQCANVSNNLVHECANDQTVPETGLVHTCASRLVHQCANPDGPSIVLEPLEIQEEQANSRPRPQAHTRETPEPEDTEPFEPLPAPQRAPTMREQVAAAHGGRLPGNVPYDPEGHERLRLFVDEWYAGRADIHNGVRLMSRVVPVEWFFRALKRLILDGRHERCGWGLPRSILDRWLTSGGPEPGPEDGYDDRMEHIKPSERRPSHGGQRRPEGRPSAPRVLQIDPERLARVQAYHARLVAESEAEIAADLAKQQVDPTLDVAALVRRMSAPGRANAG